MAGSVQIHDDSHPAPAGADLAGELTTSGFGPSESGRPDQAVYLMCMTLRLVAVKMVHDTPALTGATPRATSA
ncbi:hypothetical protein GCM10022381_15340 [Leifsonia kafniensis]|uniref:Uncharacterized protein n=1 Tax=Leifsonia kafniensis TaxID=475957 RepID=A0ABP7KCQ9_9MICO